MLSVSLAFTRALTRQRWFRPQTSFSVATKIMASQNSILNDKEDWVWMLVDHLFIKQNDMHIIGKLHVGETKLSHRLSVTGSFASYYIVSFLRLA